MKILAGDIGGTKTILQISQYTDHKFTVLAEDRFDSKSYLSFDLLLSQFLEQNQVQGQVLDSACIGVAGPVAQKEAKVTNLPWRLDSTALANEFAIPRFTLVNDFQAVGYGIEQLGAADLTTLQVGKAVDRGVRAVIGAGTGVGHAVLAWCSDGYQVLSSEAGHSSFAPVNELQQELLRYLAQQFDVVSVERALSGPGIANIFQFFCAREPDQLTEELSHATRQQEITPVVVEFAMAKKDPLAVKTLDMFVEIYGAAAGNLALFTMATGGVYIAGGIAPRIIDSLLQDHFINAFNNKSKMQHLLSDIPVKVVTNPKVGLLGAAVYAARCAA
ncbi:glucokinase [Kaarinaea lacus]